MHSPYPAFHQPDPHTDLYGMFYQLKRADISLAGGGDAVSRKERVTCVDTQNVRRFKTAARTSWFEACRRLPTGQRPIDRCLQETHVDNGETALELQDDWKRRWGQPQHVTGSPLSYWSVSADKTGGVAILLDPQRTAAARPWHPEL